MFTSNFCMKLIYVCIDMTFTFVNLNIYLFQDILFDNIIVDSRKIILFSFLYWK